jgi:hypothetical protein
MITFDHDNSKLFCDRHDWECYNQTPYNVIEEINALVYSVITTNNDPVVAQKIIYDTINANNEYRWYGFRDSEGDQCTTNIINKYYGSNIDRWAALDLRAEKKKEKWVFNVTTQPTNNKETKPMGLSALSYAKLAEALSDDVATYIREDERFQELILKMVPEAIQQHLGDVNTEVAANLVAHLAPKMYLMGLED